jgi:hypothetical protein
VVAILTSLDFESSWQQQFYVSDEGSIIVKSMLPPVAVVGMAEFSSAPGPHWDTLEESIFNCAREALEDAGVDSAELDGVVTASSDQLDGRAISVMVTSGSVAGPGHDTINLSSAGEHALIVAYSRAATGTHPVQLVVSWGRPSEANRAELDLVACEPFFTRPIGLTTTAALGIAASAYVGRFGSRDVEATRFVNEMVRRASAGEVWQRSAPARAVGSDEDWACWPLRPTHLPPAADGVSAFVLADSHAAARFTPRAWILGCDWVSGSYWLPARAYDAAAASARVISRSLARSGLDAAECGCWELQFTDPYQAFATVEAVGLCAPGEGAAYLLSEAGSMIAPSGSAYAGDTSFSTGLRRVTAAIRAVANPRFETRPASLAVAHAVSGLACQSASAFVLRAA